MKKLYTLLLFLGLTSSVLAQSPNNMSYQAVVRDSGNLLVTTQVGMQISILQGSDTGTAVYVETHTPTPNINGLVSLQIGDGSVVSGDIATIDWSNGPYFIKTETDPAGGSAYSITGTSELLSVPYALYADNMASFQDNITQSINIQNYGDCTSPIPGCASGVVSVVTSEKLAYSPGMRIRLSATSDVASFIEGIVTSYDGSNMDISVDYNNFSSPVTFSDWNINPGNGRFGNPGPKGDDGESGGECFSFEFYSDTANSDPSSGGLRQNNTDPALTTQIYISGQESNFNDITAYLNMLASNSNIVKAVLVVGNMTGDANYWAINNVIDNSGWFSLDISYLSGSAFFNDFDQLDVCFSRTGDKGDSGLVSKNILGSLGATDPSVDVTNPNEGDQWFDSATGNTFIYQDGSWQLVPITEDAKNFLGTAAGSNVDGSTSILSGMDRDPVVGDQWTDPASGEFFVFQNGQWNLLPFVENLKSNLSATSSPTVNNDSSEGYSVGSRWIDVVNDKEYVCVDNSDGSAIWKLVTTGSTDDLAEGSNLYYTDTRSDARITAQKGVASGLATLDSGGKVPASQLNLSSVAYQGTWNATTNTPTLTAGVGFQGAYYVINVSGSTNIDGITDWQIGDWIVFNGIVWEKADHTDSVTSVAGKQGAVTLVSADIADLDTSTVPESTNLYYTEARVNANTNVATNTTHRSITDNPHSVTKSQIGLSNVENLKLKLDATTSPTVNNDTSEGYSIGSQWIDIVNDKEYVCLDNTSTAAVWKETSSVDTGETNTASNIGTGGVGLFKQKNGVDLEIKKLNSGSNKITITDDTGNDEVDIDILESNIVIGNLSGAPVGSVAGISDTQTLTNKTIDADSNTVTNIGNANIKVGAAIDATKIGNGSVTNTEFQYLNTLTSNVQTQLNTKITSSSADVLTNKTLSAPQINDTSSDHQYVIGVSELTADRTITLPLLSVNDTFVFASHTQSLTNKTIDADNNTVTNIDNADIKYGADIDATKIGDGSVTNTKFQYLNGVTSSLVGVSDTQTLTNKTLNAANNTITGLTKSDVGLGNVQNVKVNLSATLAPSVNNDISEGYAVGSIWIDVTGNNVYMCVDGTVGSAIWVQLNN